MPPQKILERAAPIELWHEAAKQAARSPHRRHRTGALIHRGCHILSKGCAHPNDGNQRLHSVHAEIDAVNRLPNNVIMASNSNCIIVTLTKCNNFATISKPCTECAKRLIIRRIKYVTFAEKTNDHKAWEVYTIDPMYLTKLRIPRVWYD